MGGRFSREKGRRGEQQLVLHLAKLGYKAERILRQYQEAGQPDVKAVKSGTTTTFEMKCRRDAFQTIYDLYYKERNPERVLFFSMGGKAAAVSTELGGLYHPDAYCRDVGGSEPRPLKVYRRILNLAIIKQSADILVVKDNNRPMLFMRFWG